ncbi:uncharacterized protein LOC126706683 isoform X1 [Quercus robur]|uniref:Uncharacterized protein n=1 Tax=Quercus lobata TaxID=97700 RepID=A0A7N2KX85_QUELO|nr:uncharacterized protein LOC115978286 [Quercus lobata]XP_050262174.1 uncharacterized protein LOC126706683 isoform X1 [Quercus robur]
MKAILVVCFLLLSTFFIPSSNAARDLADQSAVGLPYEDPDKPVVTCGRGKSYRECLPGPRKPLSPPLTPLSTPVTSPSQTATTPSPPSKSFPECGRGKPYTSCIPKPPKPCFIYGREGCSSP